MIDIQTTIQPMKIEYYYCSSCGIEASAFYLKRGNTCKCGSTDLAREFSSPDNSKLIGALRASEKDGVGVLIDAGHIQRPISRGSKDSRKTVRKKSRDGF